MVDLDQVSGQGWTAVDRLPQPVEHAAEQVAADPDLERVPEGDDRVADPQAT